MNDSELQLIISEVSKNVCNYINDVVKLYITTHLENFISEKPSFSLDKKGETSMASKFREKVLVGYDETGKPIYEWVSASTKNDLHAEIFKLLAKHNDVQVAPAPTKPSTLWEDVADEWFNTFHIPKVRPNTLSKDRSLFDRHVRPAFEGEDVAKITSTDIQNHLEAKAAYCKSVVRDIMSMLKQIFSLAVDKNIITKNPMQSALVFNPSRRPDRPREAISQQDQADILSNLGKLRGTFDRHGDNMNALRFMAFLMYTGLRPCEIYGLKWEDIDTENCILWVRRDLVFVNGAGILGEPKTETSKRKIPFDPAILEYIKPFQKSGFIIHMTEKGRETEHFTEQAAFNMWNRIKKTIDVHGMTPYMGRHTYATNMNKAGVPIKTAMAMMGHKDERMLLRRYTHVDNEDLTKAASTVSSYIASNLSATE